jgi:hypothetical protein
VAARVAGGRGSAPVLTFSIPFFFFFLWAVKHNRAKLAPMGGDQERYYNASCVRGLHGETDAYIVAQAPLSGREQAGGRSTVAAFWHLVWQHSVHGILAAEVDGCPEYWPTQPRAVATHGAVTLVNKSVTHKPGFTVATLGLSCKDAPGEGERVLYHIHFLRWPAGGARAAPCLGGCLGGFFFVFFLFCFVLPSVSGAYSPAGVRRPARRVDGVVGAAHDERLYAVVPAHAAAGARRGRRRARRPAAGHRAGHHAD